VRGANARAPVAGEPDGNIWSKGKDRGPGALSDIAAKKLPRVKDWKRRTLLLWAPRGEREMERIVSHSRKGNFRELAKKI